MELLYNQLIFFAFFQSIVLLVIYSVSNKYRKKINPYIAFLIGALCIGLLGKVIYISEIFGRTHNLIIISEFAGMLFGATIYLLIISTIRREGFNKKDLVHYLPAIVYTILVIWNFVLVTPELQRAKIESGELTRNIYIFFSLGLITNIIYWSLALKAYLKFHDKMSEEVSFEVQTKFLRNFLMVTGAIMLIWLGVYIVCLIEIDFLYNLSRQFIWLTLAFTILFIAIYGVVRPEVFDINPLNSVSKYKHSKLSSKDLERLKVQLDNYMEVQKPYLNKKLLKAELAEMIGLSNPELSRLLNEKIGMNFFEYVNYFRIKEFIKRSQSKTSDNLTFFGIAQDSGFNSKTTFNKAFKKIMGSSPSEYFSTE